MYYKLCLTCLLAFVFHTGAFTALGESSAGFHGKVLEGLSMDSRILQRAVNYAVYLPYDYDQSRRNYPVVYLLHGFTDDESGWIQFGEIQAAADRAIRERTIPPMLIVMPDAGVTWYVNDWEGEVRYEDMFFEEFVPFVEAEFRIRSKKEFRGLAGLSMGGHGSLLYAMRHPDKFAAVAALSAGVLTSEEILSMEQERWDQVFGAPYGVGRTGAERLTDHWKRNSPLELAGSLPADELRKVRWYLDCGDKDFLFRGNAALFVKLREREIPHEFRMREGGHVWEYWRTGIVEGLRFIGRSFHR